MAVGIPAKGNQSTCLNCGVLVFISTASIEIVCSSHTIPACRWRKCVFWPYHVFYDVWRRESLIRVVRTIFWFLKLRSNSCLLRVFWNSCKRKLLCNFYVLIRLVKHTGFFQDSSFVRKPSKSDLFFLTKRKWTRENRCDQTWYWGARQMPENFGRL